MPIGEESLDGHWTGGEIPADSDVNINRATRYQNICQFINLFLVVQALHSDTHYRMDRHLADGRISDPRICSDPRLVAEICRLGYPNPLCRPQQATRACCLVRCVGMRGMLGCHVRAEVG